MFETKPCAKINLGLNIVERRPDGYHNLQTVFCPVPIYDDITIERNDSHTGCRLICDGIKIAGDAADNLVVKAYNELSRCNFLPGTDITLVKRIPTQAGMGGGSSDCAFTLKALDSYYSLGVSDDELREVAARLGADCPFFINPVVSYATGIGEVLDPIGFNPHGLWIMVLKPDICVSTKEAFAGITPMEPACNCREVVCSEPLENWRNLLVNDFERTIFCVHPELRRIKEAIYAHGAVYAAMSGSGSALFGLFRSCPQPLQLPGCRIEILQM